MNKEKLAEAIREEQLPKLCTKHPHPVYYDEPLCPACKAQSEFLQLTDEGKR